MNSTLTPHEETKLNAERYIALRNAFVKDMNNSGLIYTAEEFDVATDQIAVGVSPETAFEQAAA